MTLYCLLLTLMIGFGRPDGATVQPAYQFKLKRLTDAITSRMEGSKTVFTITSPSGIGSATVTLTASKWPKEVVLRLRYAKDRGFTRLEGFFVTTARMQVRELSGNGPHPDRAAFYLPDETGQVDRNAPPAGYLNITVEPREGGLEITLPPNLFTGSRKVEISWVDAYRG